MDGTVTDDYTSPAREYLYGLALHGMKLGLENILTLLRAAGDPHLQYPTVHVAGTNGKGSVVVMTHAIAAAAGLRVGRFTSPHLVRLAERFQINDELISDTALDELILFFKDLAEEREIVPTFFELCTAVAFEWFRLLNVELAVIEVGLGGRLDSTNVLLPIATAITNIDLEHTQYLGDTLELIAAEKAGIIKPRVPVLISETKQGPQGVLRRHAESLGAPVLLIERDYDCELSGSRWRPYLTYDSEHYQIGPMPFALCGNYQAQNAATAITLGLLLRERFQRITPAAIERAMTSVTWPGRMERVELEPPVILDVAHNVAGCRMLAQNLPPCVVVLAVASDKDAAGMIEALRPVTKQLIVSQFQGKRALPVAELQRVAGDAEKISSLEDAIERGRALASTDYPLLITGSIYTVGEAKRILQQREK